MTAARTATAQQKPARIGIIGGGIFGATAALMLGKHFDVTLFEQGDDILGGATYANQYRHHGGYHYPRSTETIREIKEAAPDFKRFYGSAISSEFPSYYCINAEGSRVTAEAFLKTCDRMGLSYVREYPDAEFLDASTVDLSVKTSEATYDYGRLKRLIRHRLKKERVTLKLKHEVTGARIGPQGEKVLTVLQSGRKKEYAFEYVINATYSQYNDFCRWLHFPLRRLEFRFKELVIVRIRTKPRVAVTIMDGPFATLVPIPGKRDLYTLGDVPLSIHKKTSRVRSASARNWKHPVSRWKEMFARCERWFPVLAKAQYVASMFIVLPIDVASNEADARPTECTYHGYGCWSILSGKIITSVTTAKKLLAEVRALEKKRATL